MPIFKRSSLMLAAMAAAAFSAAPLRAAVVVDNITEVIDGTYSFPLTSTAWATSFTTDNSSHTLQALAIYGSNGSNSTTLFSLYSDSAALPGTELVSFDSSSFFMSVATYTFPALSNITLDPLTTYWVVARSLGDIFLWYGTDASGNLNGPGTMSNVVALSTDSGSSFAEQVVTNYPQFSILNTAAVPEPSAVLLGAVGSLLLLRRRR